MKIPRIKLPDKNLISLREFISGWRVNYHSAGLGRFKLNLGKTTTFPRLTLVRICQQIHSLTSKTNKASKRDLLAWPSCVCQSGCGWWGDVYRGRHWDMAVVLAGDTGPGILMADELSADSPAWTRTLSKPDDANLPFLLRLASHSVRSLDQETSREMAANVPTVNKNIKGIYHGHSNISLPLSRKYFEQETSQNLAETRDTLV